MCANTGHEQKSIRSNLSDVLEQLASRGTDDVHHVLVVTPLLALANDFLKEALAILIFRELEVERAFVAGQGKQDDPMILFNSLSLGEGWGEANERRHAVLAHIGSDGQRIDVVLAEERAGIHLAGVADVAALGVGYDELVRIVLLQVLDCLLESHQSLHTGCLVEGQVRFVSDAIGRSGIDDGLVESEYRVSLREQVLGNLLEVGVKADAKEALLPLYVCY